MGEELRVLNFHGIGAPERELAPGEADFWIGADRFGDILDRIIGHPDRDRLLLTFDDGNIADLTIAAPQLLDRGLVAEFFVLTGRIGQAGSLNAGDIRHLQRLGMTIGSHGVAHRDWTSLSARELASELTASKAVLGDICGRPVRFAAIPFGRYNAAVLTALRKAGYEAAYSSDGGGMRKAAFLKPRTSIRRDTTDLALAEILAGRLPPLRRLRRTTAMAFKGGLACGEGSPRWAR